MGLETTFQIEIPDDDAEKMDTINDITKYVEKKEK